MDLLHPEFVSFLSCAKKNSLRYLLIGGYAVNYYGYNRNTHDLDVWIAPTIENRNAFINTLLCMDYSEDEVLPLYNEDFTIPFKADIGSPGAALHSLLYNKYYVDELYDVLLVRPLKRTAWFLWYVVDAFLIDKIMVETKKQKAEK